MGKRSSKPEKQLLVKEQSVEEENKIPIVRYESTTIDKEFLQNQSNEIQITEEIADEQVQIGQLKQFLLHNKKQIKIIQENLEIVQQGQQIKDQSTFQNKKEDIKQNQQRKKIDSIQQYLWNLVKFQKNILLNPQQIMFKINQKEIQCPLCCCQWHKQNHIFIQCEQTQKERENLMKVIKITKIEEYLNNYQSKLKNFNDMNLQQQNYVIFELKEIDHFLKQILNKYNQHLNEY